MGRANDHGHRIFYFFALSDWSNNLFLAERTENPRGSRRHQLKTYGTSQAQRDSLSCGRQAGGYCREQEMTSTERGTAAWIEWQNAGMTPKMTKCVICRTELPTNQPAPFYLALEDEQFEIFFPACLFCGRRYQSRASSDSGVAEAVNRLHKVVGG
jgi:hypothetical protein